MARATQIDAKRLDHLKAALDASRAAHAKAQGVLNVLLAERSKIGGELEELRLTMPWTTGEIQHRARRIQEITARQTTIAGEIDIARAACEAPRERERAAAALVQNCERFITETAA